MVSGADISKFGSVITDTVNAFATTTLEGSTCAEILLHPHEADCYRRRDRPDEAMVTTKQLDSSNERAD